MTVSVDPQLLRPSRLWKMMTADDRLVAAQLFWADDSSTDEQVQAIALIAQLHKFRPKSVWALDEERRARHLAAIASIPEAIAGRALVLLHLERRRPMMGAFLDALGIAHEEGLIRDESIQAPAREKLAPAAAQLASAYPKPEVALYFGTLVCQDPDSWGDLAQLPEFHVQS